jgi:ornithine cyclodeaminase/alanine dehydrogenase-like protein (mu-crystallin family)
MHSSATGDRLLYLSSSDVDTACRELDPLACVTEALIEHAAGTARVGVEGVIRWSPAAGESARSLNMPGLLQDHGVVGTKIINANTGNPGRELPRADGLTILFHPRTARPHVVLQAAQISAVRTAAVSTVAAAALSGRPAAVLAVVGAGRVAQAHIRLMTARLDIGIVLISDCLPARAEALARAVRDWLGEVPPVEVAETEPAVRRADILVTATTATQAHIPYDWISPGTVAVNVSLDDLDETAYLGSDLLYVDDWQLICDDTQRLLGRLARQGRVSGPGQAAPAGGRSVTGTLGQLLAGDCPSRGNESETVLVNPFGMAIEDLAVARAVCAAAESLGLGTWLER